MVTEGGRVLSKGGGAYSYPWIHYHLDNRKGCRLEIKNLKLNWVSAVLNQIIHKLFQMQTSHFIAASVGFVQSVLQWIKTQKNLCQKNVKKKKKWQSSIKYMNAEIKETICLRLRNGVGVLIKLWKCCNAQFLAIISVMFKVCVVNDSQLPSHHILAQYLLYCLNYTYSCVFFQLVLAAILNWVGFKC